MAGAAAGQGTSTDSLAIVVRLTDVESGVVVDAVTLRKVFKSLENKVAGLMREAIEEAVGEVAKRFVTE